MNVPRYCGSNVLVVPETDGCYAVWRDPMFRSWRVLRKVASAGSSPYWTWVDGGYDKTDAMETARLSFRGVEK